MLVLLHVFLIASSNLLVQYPFELFGYHTTYGAFTYPLIFILSDLATRYYGANAARKIVYQAMFPGFLTSFLFALMTYKNISATWIVSRISLACLIAYICGQLLDIVIFSKYKQSPKWYVAPLISNSISNAFDTFIFFFLAFYGSQQKYLAEHWVEIACADYAFKCIISLIAFIPLYGLLLKIKEHPMMSPKKLPWKLISYGSTNSPENRS